MNAKTALAKLTISAFAINLKDIAVFTAALALMLLLQAKVPLYPVPVTMQTLGVFVIGLFWPKKQAFLSLCGYLAMATAGLPVLSGWQSNPMWMVGPAAGFLFAFPIAAYSIAFLVEKVKPVKLLSFLAIILAGQAVIFFLGLAVLSLFVPASQLLAVGIIPFLYGDALKVAIALCCCCGVAATKKAKGTKGT